MSSFDIYQQIFCLSMKICGAANQSGTPAALEQAVAAKLTQLFTQFAPTDDWEILWGPAVWQAPWSSVADQAVAVCYNSTQNVYVVPIAATNPASPLDIFLEDLAVPPAFMQPLPGDSTVAISYGNFVALNALLSLQSGGQTLAAFLQGLSPTSGARLVVSGHSLGGGLTPVLAYSLLKQGVFGNKWTNLNVYPTAAPTVGNAAFATAFQGAFSARDAGTATYQQWNAPLYNGRDIVPHAWSSTTAPQIGEITASVIPYAALFYTSAVVQASVVALRSEATQLATDPKTSINPYTPVPSCKLFTAKQQTSGMIMTDADLATELLYQHIGAYITQFGVSSVISTAEAVATIGVPLMPLLTRAGAVAEALAEAQRASEGAEA